MTTSSTAVRDTAPPVAAAEPAVRATTGDLAATMLVALTLTVFLEELRVLMPVEWAKEPDLGLVVAGASYPLLFLVPLLAAAFHHVEPRRLLTVAVAALVTGRVVLEVARPALPLVVAVTAVTLVAVVPVLTIALAREHGAAVVTFGLVTGFAVDGAIRGASATWDRVWRPGPWPVVVTVALGAALVAALVVTMRCRPPVCAEPTRRRLPRVAAVAMLLAANVLFLQSPGYVAAAAGISVGRAVAVVVGGGALAAVFAALAFRGPTLLLGTTAGALLAVVVLLCPVASGADVPFLVIVGQSLSGVFVAVALAGAAEAPQVESMRRTATGLALGLMASFAMLVLYQVHYEHPLPISNTVLLPGLLLVATLLLAASARGHRPAALAVARGPVAVLSAGILVVGVAVGATVGATAASPRAPAAAAWPLRVMTLNVGMGVSPDGHVDLSAIADQIRRSGADVVVLEEVSRGWPLGGTQDVGGWLQHELGWQQVWAPAADHQFGNLLLSRVRLRDTEALALPQAGGSMKRSAALARLDVGGTPVTVIGAHLQHRNSTAAMQARQDELMVLLEAWGGARDAVLLGDLNPRNPDLVDLATLTAAGFSTAQGTDRCVTPTSNRNCSDYVFVAPGLRQLGPVQVVDSRTWDHRPVIATIVPAG